MATLRLREYGTEYAGGLTSQQIEQLRALAPSIAISPSTVAADTYDLTAGSTIGAIRLDGLDVVIEPKIQLDRLLFLLSYAMGRLSLPKTSFELTSAADLPEAIVPGYVYQAHRAISRGVVQGYQSVDETSLTVRGRLRISDQITRRFGIAPPAEITYDDFTRDIELNRILLAATERLLA